MAEDAHITTPLLDAALERVSDAATDHGDEDLAAVYELSPPASTPRATD